MYDIKMIKTPKLAIFDVDGTIATKAIVPEEILDGIRHLHSRGCMTTISTGRGYIRLKDSLGEKFNEIVSDDALIIIEHGTKIVNKTGEIIFGEYLSEEEKKHIIDFARINIELFKVIWYNPADVSKKVQIWVADERYVQSETEYRGHYANLFTSPIGVLEQQLLENNITNVTLRFKEHVKVENLKLAFTKTDTSIIFQDGNMEFVKNNINKGISVLYLAKKLAVSSEDMLIPGNAINDIEMLDLGTGISVLVGPKEERTTIESYLSDPGSLVKIDSPVELGKYLQTL